MEPPNATTGGKAIAAGGMVIEHGYTIPFTGMSEPTSRDEGKCM